MSLIGATVFIATATTVLAAGAIITAVFAGLALRKQSGELEAMEKQVEDQRSQLKLQQEQFNQQAEDRRRAQACRVFIWTEERTSPMTQAQRESLGPALREAAAVHVKNSSQQPIYDLTISWHRGTAPWGEPDHVPVLLPEKQEDRTRAYPVNLPDPVDLSLFGAVARFRDAAAVHWLLWPDGRLEEDPPAEERDCL
jgi:hypothetical protein